METVRPESVGTYHPLAEVSTLTPSPSRSDPSIPVIATIIISFQVPGTMFSTLPKGSHITFKAESHAKSHF